MALATDAAHEYLWITPRAGASAPCHERVCRPLRVLRASVQAGGVHDVVMFHRICRMSVRDFSLSA